ncbi:hypothetical protein STRCI_001285 [Streptomyces cinnabarinus]|uniref:Uncharacterized protein n=1 Tax=Streptomyces cinnabarinus TaxID=67287 RepID=A0ABY7KBP8_9ACTN|nr:hypothetical protein [Streptomyces cinnabarinus]WAZ20186.1 hypothetical protein STRCI_001285 [Streptomyces cinnabarinus]
MSSTSGRYIPDRKDFVLGIVDGWAKERGKEGSPALSAITDYILGPRVLVPDQEWETRASTELDEDRTREILEECLDALDKHRDISTIPPEEVAQEADPIFGDVQKKKRCPWPFHRC